MPEIEHVGIDVADGWTDFELIASGDSEKLERWGDVRLARPDPQALWPKADPARWRQADARYQRDKSGGGRWQVNGRLDEEWAISLGDLRFKIRPTQFKHTGLFPEQAANWHWFTEKIAARGKPVRVLNLFGYTGGATVAAAAAGAEVCHVDAAKGMVQWCRDNASLSGLADAPIRFITDDCGKFVKRELKRGRRYDAIIMDPPVYGRGSGGEMWKLEKGLWPLLDDCRALLSDEPLFFVLNTYTAGLSPIAVGNLLARLLDGLPGTIEIGELALRGSSDSHVLPCGVFGRWGPEA